MQSSRGSPLTCVGCSNAQQLCRRQEQVLLLSPPSSVVATSPRAPTAQACEAMLADTHIPRGQGFLETPSRAWAGSDPRSPAPGDTGRAEVQTASFSLPVQHRCSRMGPPAGTSDIATTSPPSQSCTHCIPPSLASESWPHARESTAPEHHQAHGPHQVPGSRRGPPQEQGPRCAQALPIHEPLLEADVEGKALPRNHTSKSKKLHRTGSGRAFIALVSFKRDICISAHCKGTPTLCSACSTVQGTQGHWAHKVQSLCLFPGPREERL